MAGMDMLFDNAIKLLIAKLPPETAERLANVAQIAIDLDGKLDGMSAEIAALKAGQAELRHLLVTLIQQLQPKGNGHG